MMRKISRKIRFAAFLSCIAIKMVYNLLAEKEEE
jgi:hypothetical protein